MNTRYIQSLKDTDEFSLRYMICHILMNITSNYSFLYNMTFINYLLDLKQALNKNKVIVVERNDKGIIDGITNEEFIETATDCIRMIIDGIGHDYTISWFYDKANDYVSFCKYLPENEIRVGYIGSGPNGLSYFIDSSQTTSQTSTINDYKQQNQKDICEVENLKARINRLEAIIDKRTKLIQAMEEYNQTIDE